MMTILGPSNPMYDLPHPFQITRFPLTTLSLLGREWHAEYFTNELIAGRLTGKDYLKMGDIGRAVKAILANDY